MIIPFSYKQISDYSSLCRHLIRIYLKILTISSLSFLIFRLCVIVNYNINSAYLGWLALKVYPDIFNTYAWSQGFLSGIWTVRLLTSCFHLRGWFMPSIFTERIRPNQRETPSLSDSIFADPTGQSRRIAYKALSFLVNRMSAEVKSLIFLSPKLPSMTFVGPSPKISQGLVP